MWSKWLEHLPLFLLNWPFILYSRPKYLLCLPVYTNKLTNSEVENQWFNEHSHSDIGLLQDSYQYIVLVAYV